MNTEIDNSNERYVTFYDHEPLIIGGETYLYTVKVSRLGLEQGFLNSKNDFVPADAFTFKPIKCKKPQGILEILNKKSQ